MQFTLFPKSECSTNLPHCSMVNRAKEIYATKNSKNHLGVISFNIKGVHPHDVASILDSCNVAIRSGNHCAQPLMRYLGIDSTCRASLYFYNTKEDIDKLVNGIQKAYKMFEKFIIK